MLEFGEVLAAALWLDLDIFAARVPGADLIWVAILAGLSTVLGHIAIFKINRVTGFHLLTSVLLNAALLALLYLVQVGVIWIGARIVAESSVPWRGFAQAALLALAPLLFNVLTAFPYFGIPLARLLEIWSAIILWLGVSTVLEADLWVGLIITVTGWLVMQAMSRLVAKPLSAVMGRAWTLATGRETRVTARDILAGTPFIPVDASVKELA